MAGQPEVIGQEAFIAEAESVVTGEQLAGSIAKAVSAASALNEKFVAIGDGDLVVKPPLSEEKLAYYRGRTEATLEIGQKTLKALQGAGASREEGKEGGLKGAGAEAKGAKPRKP